VDCSVGSGHALGWTCKPREAHRRERLPILKTTRRPRCRSRALGRGVEEELSWPTFPPRSTGT
jgi:hypothetical protein